MSGRWKGIFQRLEHNVKENSSMSKNAMICQRKEYKMSQKQCSMFGYIYKQFENFDGDSWWWRSNLGMWEVLIELLERLSNCCSFIWMYWMLVQFEGVAAGTEIKKLKGSWTVIQLLIHRRSSQGFSQNSENSKWSWKRLALSSEWHQDCFSQRNETRVINANRLAVWKRIWGDPCFLIKGNIGWLPQHKRALSQKLPL